jgi:hypothetical protein
VHNINGLPDPRIAPDADANETIALCDIIRQHNQSRIHLRFAKVGPGGRRFASPQPVTLKLNLRFNFNATGDLCTSCLYDRRVRVRVRVTQLYPPARAVEL